MRAKWACSAAPTTGIVADNGSRIGIMYAMWLVQAPKPRSRFPV